MVIGSHKINITDKTKQIFILVFLLTNFTQCEKPYHEKFKQIQSWDISYEDGSLFPQHQKGNAAQGNFFTRANDKQEWTDYFMCQLPDSLFGKTIRFNINCFIRKSHHGDGQSVVVQFIKNNEAFYWQEFLLDEYTTKTNTWALLSDSGHVQIQDKVVEQDKIIMCIAGRNQAKYPFIDIDDLKIQLKEVEIIKNK